MKFYKKLFGEKLRQAREAKGWKQWKLADKLNVKPSAISRWENGKDFPEEERLSAIYALLDVNEDYFKGPVVPMEKPIEARALATLVEENKKLKSQLTELEKYRKYQDVIEAYEHVSQSESAKKRVVDTALGLKSSESLNKKAKK